MALLGAGGIPLLDDGVRPPDADNPEGYHEYEPVRRLLREAGWLEEARGHAVKVVVPLLRALPVGLPCRVVLMRREIGEVVASQERMLARRGAPSGGLSPGRVAGILSAQLDEALEWLRARPSTPWLELDYHALVHAPAEPLAALAAFAGLRGPAERLAAVIRPSLHRQRGPTREGPAASATGPSRGDPR